MDHTQLRPGAFRGASLYVTSVRTGGGKANSKDKIPDSDRQKVDDLGNLDNTYQVQGFISSRLNSDGTETIGYKQMRDNLIAAFRLPGTGIFINPWGDDVHNAMAVDWDIEESIASLNLTPVSITLEISSVDEVVVSAGPSIEEVAVAADEVADKVNTEIAESYFVTLGFSGNFQDGIDQVNKAIDDVVKATEPIQIELDALDLFYSGIATISENVTTLVNTPQALADSIVNMVQGIGGLYTSAEGTVGAFRTLFDFGFLVNDQEPSTAGLKERNGNRATLNTTIQTLALSESYRFASQIEYETVDDIDTMNELLENQYQKIKTDQESINVIDDELHEVSIALADTREATQRFFDAERINARRVITVATKATSARLLAYQYYGSSELGSTIANLNNLNDSDFLEGDVKIVTQ